MINCQKHICIAYLIASLYFLRHFSDFDQSHILNTHGINKIHGLRQFGAVTLL